MTSRKYQSKLRAQRKAETQRRIVEAAVKLHGQGIIETAAIAEEAGVSPSTVRKYYPTHEDIFQACTSHFEEEYPLLSLDEIAAIADFDQLLETAVSEAYDMFELSFGQNWLMYRLEDDYETLAEERQAMEGFLDHVAEIIATGPGERQNVSDEALAFVRTQLSALTYRAMRNEAGLAPEQCIAEAVRAIAWRLGQEKREA